MRILGVDPGSVVTGWAVVDCAGNRLGHVESGSVRAGRGAHARRLGDVLTAVSEVIATYHPEHLSLESGFLARNVHSAFRLGEARGVVLAAAGRAGVSVSEYSPATIKKAVTGYGRAAKEQVQQAVVRLLALEGIPPEDEADAIAAALCHGFRHVFDSKARSALARTDRSALAAGGPKR